MHSAFETLASLIFMARVSALGSEEQIHLLDQAVDLIRQLQRRSDLTG